MIESLTCVVVTGITCSVNESTETITLKKNSNHYAHCITSKPVTSLLGPLPRQCTRATQLLLKKSQTMTSRRQLCVRFEPMTFGTRVEYITTYAVWPVEELQNRYY